MAASIKPILAVTMGDPAGIGAEVIIGAWGDPRIHEQVRPLGVGHPEILRRAARLLNRDINVVEIEPLTLLKGLAADPKTVPCIKVCSDEVLDVPAGRVDARAGEAAFRAIELAATLAREKKVGGIVTAPLSKAALQAAGHQYPGHTELLAEMCGVADFAMMLYLPAGEAVRSPNGLGVVHVTLHQSLRSVFADLTPEAVVAKCRLADAAMRRLGAQRPRLAVCALNPHAGEDGLFGDEERTIIVPAVEHALREGLDVSGPNPTDTLMVRARDGEFDAVVAMYHDQGHIALKLLGIHAAVNITLGLPIVRTSVAHGTAFDRAWQGTACCEGMVAAIVTAARLIQQRA
ncbi:MAG: 4-hydroxythreonine-4-phosphate dehydrogenase PdxA [Pirellulales bacterium]